MPAAKPLVIAALDRRGKPHTLCRDIYRGWGGRRFAALARLNGNGESKLTKEFGGGFVYGPPYHCHTWDRYVPFAKYGKEYPEWFSLVNGKRVGGLIEGQLCLTNREMMDFFIGEVEKSVAKGAVEAKVVGDAKLEKRVRLARSSIDRVESICRGWKIDEGGSQECPVSRDLRDPSWCFAYYGTFQFAEDGDLGGATVAKSKDADRNKLLGLPFDCEAWDPVLKKIVKFNPIQKAEAGWKWYDFGVAEFTPSVEYIHLSRDWTMQLYLPPKNADALGGKKVRIEALLKFEGPRYSLPGDKSAVSVRNVRFTPVD